MFAVSSEIKSLAEIGPITFNERYFSTVMKWGYCPEGFTPFKEIIKILPGMEIIYSVKHSEILSMRYYTELVPRKDINIRKALKESVKNRMVSDVPIALLMSGGLDSTIIYYLMRQYCEEMTIFHVDNDEATFLEYIDFRPGDRIIQLDSKDQRLDLYRILYHNDGPVDLGSLIPQYRLSQEIAKYGIQVCLSGDGADELFGGYGRAQKYDSQYSDIYHELVYYHLPRLDKLMMMNTIELRCPFLAKGVIEGAMGLLWYPYRYGKRVLKNIFSDLVPNQIIVRDKKPLKSKPILEDSFEWRKELVYDYKSIYRKKGAKNERE